MNTISRDSLQIECTSRMIIATWTVHAKLEHLRSATIGFVLVFSILIGGNVYLLDFGTIAQCALATSILIGLLCLWSLVLAWRDRRCESLMLTEVDCKVCHCFPFYTLELAEPSFEDVVAFLPHSTRCVDFPTAAVSRFQVTNENETFKLWAVMDDGNDIAIVNGASEDVNRLMAECSRWLQQS